MDFRILKSFFEDLQYIRAMDIEAVDITLVISTTLHITRPGNNPSCINL